MTNVIQLQTTMGSAGSSAIRLHRVLVQHGIDSHILSLYPDSITDSKITYLTSKSRLLLRMDAKLIEYRDRNIHKEFGSFSSPIMGTDVSQLPQVATADIIYLHWILGGFLNITNLEKLFRLGKPTVIIMHDMWWITGGCHHSLACKKYQSECSNCPFFPGDKIKDLSYRGFHKKLVLFQKYDNLHFVSPSRWLYDCAKKSKLISHKPIYYIPNIIDNTFFKPVNKGAAKEMLDMEAHEIVISFGASNIDSAYKGWSYLEKALQILADDTHYKNIKVLIFGKGFDTQLSERIPFNILFMGYLDPFSLKLAYNASDVFIIPSIADNQPTVVMESLCCGTAVVGFEVGGIPDMIRHKENGYLAKYKDAQDLANGIKYCIQHNIKGKILPSFDKNIVIKEHINLINSLLPQSEKAELVLN